MAEEGTCGRIFLFILCLIAWALSVASIADCSFLLIDIPSSRSSSNGGSGSYPSGTSYPRKLTAYEDYSAFGAFSYDADREEHYCVPYPDNMFELYFNTPAKAARGFGVVASVSFGITLLLIMATCLFLESKTVQQTAWNTGFGLALLAIPTQLLTFLILLVDPCRHPEDYGAKNCYPGIAGGMSFLSALLFVWVAITMSCCVKPPSKPLLSISDMRRQRKQLGWAMVALSVITWILSVVAVVDCTFVRTGSRKSKYSDLAEYGIFNYNDDDPNGHICVAFDRSLDPGVHIRSARVFGTLAALLSGIAMFGMLSLQLFLRSYKETVWKMIRIQTALAVVCQTITFAIFGTDACSENPDTKCVPGPAAIVAALNVVLLAILSGLCWGVGPPRKPIFKVELMPEEEEPHHPNDEGDTVGSDHDGQVSPKKAPPTAYTASHVVMKPTPKEAKRIIHDPDLSDTPAPAPGTGGGVISVRKKADGQFVMEA